LQQQKQKHYYLFDNQNVNIRLLMQVFKGLAKMCHEALLVFISISCAITDLFTKKRIFSKVLNQCSDFI